VKLKVEFLQFLPDHSMKRYRRKVKVGSGGTFTVTVDGVKGRYFAPTPSARAYQTEDGYYEYVVGSPVPWAPSAGAPSVGAAELRCLMDMLVFQALASSAELTPYPLNFFSKLWRDFIDMRRAPIVYKQAQVDLVRKLPEIGTEVELDGVKWFIVPRNKIEEAVR